jgi:hypothetical protein
VGKDEVIEPSSFVSKLEMKLRIGEGSLAAKASKPCAIGGILYALMYPKNGNIFTLWIGAVVGSFYFIGGMHPMPQAKTVHTS